MYLVFFNAFVALINFGVRSGFYRPVFTQIFFLGVSRERGDRADMSLRENCRYVGPTNLRV